ncbi:MAG: hypothetical protein GC131_06980 [Alphaproteobacteria bacterium]|nr:hypothetical protein [Alphaproteobacteria bacterium]
MRMQTLGSLWSAYLLPRAVMFVLTLAVTLGALKGGAMAAVGIGGALLLYGLATWSRHRFPAPDRSLGFLLAAFLLLAGLSALHSMDPAVSWHTVLELISIMVPLWLLTAVPEEAGPPFVWYKWMAGAVLLLLLLFWCEFMADGPVLRLFGFTEDPAAPLSSILNYYNRGFCYLSVLIWPLLAGLAAARYKQTALTLFGVTLFVALFGESSTVVLSLLVGGAVFLLAHAWPRLIAAGLGAGFAIYGIGWPFAARILFANYAEQISRFPPSWQHRMEIWDYVAARILDRPLTGWGAGTSGQLDTASTHAALYHIVQGPASHTHNALMQAWVELGPLGLLVGLVFALLLLARAAGSIMFRPYMLAAWAAATAMALLAFDAWADSLWATFALACFWFARLRGQTVPNGQ